MEIKKFIVEKVLLNYNTTIVLSMLQFLVAMILFIRIMITNYTDSFELLHGMMDIMLFLLMDMTLITTYLILKRDFYEN